MTILEANRRQGQDIPFAMSSPMWVPRERYYDRQFFELEKTRFWPRVWQMACRLEEIPRPGDFVEYEICDQSILLVRQPDRSVKGFFNACRHRATALCRGAGRLAGGQITCPFHGWRWNLDGSNSFVYGEEGFATECLDREDLRLTECRVETWGACAWINMDPGARPLRESLSPAAGILDRFGVEDLRVYWWKEAIIPANWKLAQEAFYEGYHLQATHPQLTMGAGEMYPPGYLDYKVFDNGHSLFQQRPVDPAATAEMELVEPGQFLEFMRALWEGQDSMVLERDVRVVEGLKKKVAPGGDEVAAATNAVIDYDNGAGIPIRTAPEAMQLWGGEVFVFPNFFILPWFSNALSYRVRPYNDDPELCRFEVWSLTMPAEGEEVPRAKLEGRYSPDDTEHWGLIPRQDFSNLEREQRGLHTLTYRQHRLAMVWERAISNMHEELDRYLAR